MATKKAGKKRVAKTTPKSTEGTGVRPANNKLVPVVGIGASAGGLDALKKLFDAMPDQPELAFVLVQHLDPTHESMMVDLLSRHTRMKVVQVTNEMAIEANTLYIIPPNRDLAMVNGHLILTEPSQRRGFRMPIDYFLRSLAEDMKERAICIILSGTGSDGTLGVKAIKGYGGMAMAQTPKEAQYDGMPVSALSTGAIDYVLPAREMPVALLKYVQHSYVRGRFGTEPVEDEEKTDVNTVLAIMNAQLGHNFHYYKKNTLVRRIKRRMGLKQLENMKDYVRYLRAHQEETSELFKDLLIGVTEFFREGESWAELEKKVIPEIIAGKEANSPIRIWVPGCASGEEAYTIAILLHEHLLEAGKNPEFQLFATDIDTNALEIARVGRYPESIASAMTPARLQKYFTKEDDFYRISGRLRDNVVFSEQNLISDPPFSKLDLISCHNLLIYLEAEIQDRVIEMFHFALSEKGYLVLGASETIGQQTDLFKRISKKWRIFQRIENMQRKRPAFPILPDKRRWDRLNFGEQRDKALTFRASDLVNQTLLELYAPTAILINNKHEILYHFGETVNYLRFPAGEPTTDLYAYLREGLLTKLRGAIHKVLRDGQQVSVHRARVKREGRYFKVNFMIHPLRPMNGYEEFMLITFSDEKEVESSPDILRPDLDKQDESVVQQLEYELSTTREDLQNTIEELETSNEELKASNEEVMSMNEELQSSNEELETSKEELQSLNEELNTVNNELQEKVASVESTNNDLTNLINSTSVASIFLDTKFRIKFFTPASKKLFRLIATDLGRPLEDIAKRTTDQTLLADAAGVLNELRISAAEVHNDEGRWFNRRILPYRTSDNRIEGLVISYEDITHLKEGQKALRLERDKARKYLNLANAMFVALDRHGKIDLINQKACEVLGYREEELLGADWFGKCLPAEIRQEVRGIHEELLQGRLKLSEYHENPVLTRKGENRHIAWHNAFIHDEDGKISGTISTGEDITDCGETDDAGKTHKS